MLVIEPATEIFNLITRMPEMYIPLQITSTYDISGPKVTKMALPTSILFYDLNIQKYTLGFKVLANC
jgi:hypothetical protein